MKKSVIAFVPLFCILLFGLQAESKPSEKVKHGTATVVSVEKYEAPSNYLGGGATDAPLQADSYSYDIGIRLNCNIYVGRYESAIDYLPNGFAPHQQVDVRLKKHILYVTLPYHDGEVKMGIVSHRRMKDDGCGANS